MSSTDGTATQELTPELERIFARLIVPAAEALRARHEQFFELAASVNRLSYFVDRPCRVLSAQDFERPIVRTSDDLAARLRELWAGQPELLEMVDRFRPLAKRCERAEEGDETVSDLVYPMY